MTCILRERGFLRQSQRWPKKHAESSPRPHHHLHFTASEGRPFWNYQFNKPSDHHRLCCTDGCESHTSPHSDIAAPVWPCTPGPQQCLDVCRGPERSSTQPSPHQRSTALPPGSRMHSTPITNEAPTQQSLARHNPPIDQPSLAWRQPIWHSLLQGSTAQCSAGHSTPEHTAYLRSSTVY